MTAAKLMVPANAVGLQLYKIVKEDLIACEEVYFVGGAPAVHTTLQRAALSGRVEVEGEIGDYYADVLIDTDGSWETTVALDANSYRALKTKWMKCKIQKVR